MSVKRIARWVLLLALLAIGSTAAAQDDPSQNKSLLDRLDNFGKGIVNIFVPGDKSKNATNKDGPPTTNDPQSLDRNPGSLARNPAWDQGDGSQESPRAGSILSGDVRTPTSPVAGAPSQPPLAQTPAGPLPALQAGGSASKPVPPPPADLLPFETPSLSEAGKPNSAPVPPSSASPSDGLAQPSELAAPSKPAIRPLHEQLLELRHSPFPSNELHESGPQADLPAGNGAGASADNQPVPAESARVPTLAKRPAAVRRLRLAARTGSGPSAGPSLTLPAAAPTSPVSPATHPNPDNPVLFTNHGPSLAVETLGPRKIAVGKESTYEVSIANSGEVAADDLVVFVSLPAWAEVSATEATIGSAQAAAAGGGVIVQWRIGHLNVKGNERLVLRIVPRQSRPFDLAVRWEFKPMTTQAEIEVQEPKLVLQLEGPHEVLYGKKESYRLKLANTGTGSAENVTITLIPLGTGDNVPASHKLGVLPAGEQKVLDVDLTARQAGHLTIQAQVRAEGGAHAELTEDVVVRRADLKIDVEGPAMQFVGQPAAYTVRVRNAGTASARNLRFSASLPTAATDVSGIDAAKLNPTGTRLEWALDELAPEVQQSYVIRCRLGAAGANRLEIHIAAENDVSAVAVANTRVEAVADLVMNVKDPAGPVAVGAEAVYEVRVRNRGTKEADNVEVFAYFSRGVEPISAEGAANQLAPGQVIFRPIASLAPGAEVVLKVHARAGEAGNHVFRAETRCPSLGTHLMSEATNLFYGDGPGAPQMAGEATSAASRPGGVRPQPAPAADHPSQAEVTPTNARK